jgi:hypothetical protein
MLNQGLSYEKNVVPRTNICIVKLSLRIPLDADGYEDFSAQMKLSEQVFVNYVMKK